MLPLPRTPMPVLLWYYGNSDRRTERLKIIKRTDEQDEQERLWEEREAGKKQRERNPGDIKILDNSRFSDLEKWPSSEKTRPNETQTLPEILNKAWC